MLLVVRTVARARDHVRVMKIKRKCCLKATALLNFVRSFDWESFWVFTICHKIINISELGTVETSMWKL